MYFPHTQTSWDKEMFNWIAKLKFWDRSELVRLHGKIYFTKYTMCSAVLQSKGLCFEQLWPKAGKNDIALSLDFKMQHFLLRYLPGLDRSGNFPDRTDPKNFRIGYNWNKIFLDWMVKHNACYLTHHEQKISTLADLKLQDDPATLGRRFKDRRGQVVTLGGGRWSEQEILLDLPKQNTAQSNTRSTRWCKVS